jgi:hypothetical protein
MLPDFKSIEAEVERAILERFGVPWPLPPQIKQADLRVLAAEQKQIMPEGTDGWVRGQKVEPAPILVRYLTPDQAKQEFLERHEVLRSSYLLRSSKRAGQGSRRDFSGGSGEWG